MSINNSLVLPVSLLRPMVFILPMSMVSYLDNLIPQWQTASPTFFSTPLGTVIYTCLIYLAGISSAGFFYYIYLGKPRTPERIGTANFILLLLYFLLESL